MKTSYSEPTPAGSFLAVGVNVALYTRIRKLRATLQAHDEVSVNFALLPLHSPRAHGTHLIRG
jgi:hypothetical protein